MNAAELRAAIERAHQAHELAGIPELQAQLRALAPRARAQLLTAEQDDQHARRRIVSCWGPKVSRATPPVDEAAGTPTLYGHFAVFDVWTEVESFWEGNFIESIAEGAFAETMKNDRDRMRVTLNHGRDPYLGNRVLGGIDVLREDNIGAYYEVPLYAGLAKESPLLMDGLRDDAYGASFRFYVMQEQFTEKPKASSYNPRALPERVITEAMVEEFGPVTFPQYPEATAHVRSIVRQRAKPTAAGMHGREITSRKDRDAWIRSLA